MIFQKSHYFIGLASLALLSLSPLSVATTVEKELDNGLRVIVRSDHRAPVVVSQIWYKVGSSYEHDGITGVSHVLEHMMFKGTEAYPTGEFSRIIAENGGSENAFTSYDYTAYYQQLEKSRLPVSFKMEADRMRNLTLPDEEFRKEAKVVMEERRLRTEDKPASLTYEAFKASAFMSSGYGQPIIGWMDDLESLTREDLQQWYGKWYSPNNATLVVVGDVVPEEVFTLAEESFGKIPSSKTAILKPRIEPRQRGERRIVVRAPAKLPVVLLGFKVPVLATSENPSEAYALEMLANVLDGGDSARLTRNLIRGSAIAASASAGYDLTSRQMSLFTLEATPVTATDPKTLESALLAQINDLQQNLVTHNELARIKAQVKAEKIYELDSIFYQAMQLGRLVTVGLDWRIGDEYLQKISTITPEEIRAVAQKYLISDALTVAYLEPTSK